jgi:hypothetical protein
VAVGKRRSQSREIEEQRCPATSSNGASRYPDLARAHRAAELLWSSNGDQMDGRCAARSAIAVDWHATRRAIPRARCEPSRSSTAPTVASFTESALEGCAGRWKPRTPLTQAWYGTQNHSLRARATTGRPGESPADRPLDSRSAGRCVLDTCGPVVRDAARRTHGLPCPKFESLQAFAGDVRTLRRATSRRTSTAACASDTSS